MKRLLSLILTAVTCMCMLTMLTGCSEPENDYAGWNGNWQVSTIYDGEYNEKGLFSEQQIRELEAQIQQKAQELEMNILIYIGGSYRTNEDTKPFCDSTYDSWFGNDTDGLIYYLDLSGKKPAYDYISTSGKAILMYEDCREAIFDHLDNYLPASGQEIIPDEIYDAVVEFLDQLTVYSKSGSHRSYYHDKRKGTYIYYKGDKLFITRKKPLILWVRIWIVSAIVGLLTALISFLASKGNYKFKAKTNPSVYLSKDNVNYTQKSDTHIRTYQTRRKIESSSGGGGSRGGGGGGGGGSHGGGGHSR